MFIKLHSIKGYNSFSKIYKVGMKFRSGSASAVVIFSNTSIDFSKLKENTHCNANNNFKHIIYYGVTVSKKIAKKAVVRNRIKRLMRESLRIVIKELEIKNLLPIEKIIISYFFAPKHPMQISLNNILPAVKNLLKQAYFHHSNTNKNANKNNKKNCNTSNNLV